MKLNTTFATMLSIAAILPSTAMAEGVSEESVAALLERLSKMEKEVLALRGQLDSAQSEKEVEIEVVEEEDELDVNWKGAPEIKGGNGWSVKPRGRFLYDAAHLSSVPESINIPGEGFSNEVRRARFGIQGTMPGGFGYKFEVDYAGGSALTDAYLSYKDGSMKIIVGQHNNFQGLAELTSSNDYSFIERAAFTDAFGFERRLGLSATYKVDELQFQGGIFTDNVDDLDDGNDSYSLDGRVTYAPKYDGAQLHFGTSIHSRELGDEMDSVRYRQRPLVHSVDTRFVNTGNISGTTSEFSYGLEAAIVKDRFHAIAETHWVNVERTNMADPTFFGSSIEAGYFLTNDQRQYKDGVLKGAKVSSPVGNGGIGAWQVNFKYDHLDLVDSGIVGGTQDAYIASLIWTPVNNVRFLVNYGHISYSDTLDIVGGAPSDFSVNVFGARAQVSF
ncbi:MAG: phosphate-selective porin OprO/OprP [Glaciecola sp.]|jgi:phosphate-selective porin OprO/OprP|mmetsp:Transcript_55587/g.176498  ORF Transcript_55587/g.176498 Transcript_55587/m.176498 type:complete len:446 (+) Transcript_55587:93-1430(+)